MESNLEQPSEQSTQEQERCPPKLEWHLDYPRKRPIWIKLPGNPQPKNLEKYVKAINRLNQPVIHREDAVNIILVAPDSPRKNALIAQVLLHKGHFPTPHLYTLMISALILNQRPWKSLDHVAYGIWLYLEIKSSSSASYGLLTGLEDFDAEKVSAEGYHLLNGRDGRI